MAVENSLQWYQLCCIAGIPPAIYGLIRLFKRSSTLDARDRQIISAEDQRLYTYLHTHPSSFAIVFQQRHTAHETPDFKLPPTGQIFYEYYDAWQGGQFFSKADYESTVGRLFIHVTDPKDPHTECNGLPVVPQGQFWPVVLTVSTDHPDGLFAKLKNQSPTAERSTRNLPDGNKIKIFTAGIDSQGLVYYDLKIPHSLKKHFRE